MNILRYLPLTLLILVLLVGPAAVDAQEETVGAAEAQGLLENYFLDLQSGNTTDILNLISGPLLQKREHLLKYNAQYGAFLRRHYENANLTISPPMFMHNNMPSIRATIAFEGQDKLNYIFSFSLDSKDGTLKIYSEETQ